MATKKKPRLTKSAVNDTMKQLIRDDLDSSSYEMREGLNTLRFVRIVKVRGMDELAEEYVNTENRNIDRAMARTILKLDSETKNSRFWKLMVRNAKMQIGDSDMAKIVRSKSTKAKKIKVNKPKKPRKRK
jgi:hypothetical protein